MICPYCNKEMEKGHIAQTSIGYPLKWMPIDDGTTFFRSPKKDIKLTSIYNSAVPVHYCRDCKKFLIDQAEIDIA